MTISDLFKTRQTNYYKTLSKYLKYVLNDHFVILILFLGGATALAYQNYLESIHISAVVPRIILFLIISITLFSGSIRTLIEPADAVFLLPKEKKFDKIMKKNMIYSLFFHSLITLLVGIITAPILIAIGHIKGFGIAFWLLSLVFWKNIYVLNSYYSLKQHKRSTNKNIVILIVALFTITLALSLFMSALIGFLISAVLLVLFLLYVLKHAQTESWNWEKLIETEQRRIQKIYSVINLFVETPYSKHKVKRLKNLDFLYNIKVLKKEPEIYFLSRMFVRNYNFSGLYLRLLIIGNIAIYFSESWIVNSIVSVLFLYLIGFQLIPLKQIIRDSIHFRLYPAPNNKIKPTQHLILLLLIVSSLLFALSAVSAGAVPVIRLLFFNSTFTAFFIYIYLPARLKK
ncbi:MAG: ABC transporter permease [Alkalibacterium gilvum]|uniref:ABC transporter permease n=1 Tax=Alkalibacterium gilvum TaxID=1130080 RepID=UPI000EBC3CEB|nr:hypothetical protein [Alkalibacterium sp.]